MGTLWKLKFNSIVPTAFVNPAKWKSLAWKERSKRKLLLIQWSVIMFSTRSTRPFIRSRRSQRAALSEWNIQRCFSFNNLSAKLTSILWRWRISKPIPITIGKYRTWECPLTVKCVADYSWIGGKMGLRVCNIMFSNMFSLQNFMRKTNHSTGSLKISF